MKDDGGVAGDVPPGYWEALQGAELCAVDIRQAIAALPTTTE